MCVCTYAYINMQIHTNSYRIRIRSRIRIRIRDRIRNSLKSRIRIRDRIRKKSFRIHTAGTTLKSTKVVETVSRKCCLQIPYFGRWATSTVPYSGTPMAKHLVCRCSAVGGAAPSPAQQSSSPCWWPSCPRP